LNRKKFHKILIANRGEIAVRIIRAIRELDKLAVVIYSDYDSDLPFVTMADEAYPLGSGSLADTYLNIDKIVSIAREANADAIHPGYGFLAENSVFAKACQDAGIRFIGPGPEVIDLMGNKANARHTAEKLGLPVLTGYTGTAGEMWQNREKYAYPVLVKPAEGGGGKGMRVVHSAAGLEEAIRDAGREAKSYFGSDQLYIEKYLDRPRHIEVQVIADHHGNAVHLFERECSLQRRYQKIIEEAPSGFLTPEARKRITDSALTLVNGIKYRNAGTVEFLADGKMDHYFLEMNTRIQVEHPVTETITGIDLVREQITIAEGSPLSFVQDQVVIKGHAIEARIYAEDPEREFMPSTGRIDMMQEPSGPETRIDSGYEQGNLVEPYYDPMISKVIASGNNRNDARNHLIGTLRDYRLTGLITNRDFLIELLRSPDFMQNHIDTGYVDRELQNLLDENRRARDAWPGNIILCAAALISLQHNFRGDLSVLSPWHNIGHWRMLPEIVLQYEHEQFRIGYELKKARKKIIMQINEATYDVSLEREMDNSYWIRINKQLIKVWGLTDRSDIFIDLDGHRFRIRRTDILDRRYLSGKGQDTGETGLREILAPLHGKVVQIAVRDGSEVSKGDTMLIIESMKMENKLLAPMDTKVMQVHVSVGDQVEMNKLLITLN